MPTDLLLEAFGQLDPHQVAIVAAEEDLYSVFRERSELMGWSSMHTSMQANLQPSRRPLFWDMHEAELTAGHEPMRIGWVQVGLASRVTGIRPAQPPGPGWAPWPDTWRNDVEPAQVVPALCQCLADALRRFGDLTLTGMQLTAYGVEPLTHDPGSDIAGHNWFNLLPQLRTPTVASFDQMFPAAHDLLTYLQRWNTGSCTFRSVVLVSAPHRIAVSSTRARTLVPAMHGVDIMLPEWTASAVGWAMAFIIDAARVLTPNIRQYVVRITRM